MPGTQPAFVPFPFFTPRFRSLFTAASVPSLVDRPRFRSPLPPVTAARREDGEAVDPTGGQPGCHEPGELARLRLTAAALARVLFPSRFVRRSR